MRKYLDMALQVSQKSKDPSTKVGYVMTSKDDKLIGVGYNAFPQYKQGRFLTYERPLKYHTIVHAEMDAIASAQEFGELIQGSTMYGTDAPCDMCLKQAIHVGVEKIVYNNSRVILSRGSDEQLLALEALLLSYDIVVVDRYGTLFIDEILEEQARRK